MRIGWRYCKIVSDISMAEMTRIGTAGFASPDARRLVMTVVTG